MIKLDNLIKCRVEQLANKNQFVIEYNDYTKNQKLITFQSYRTIICYYNPMTKSLYVNWHKWDYSKTTMKHLKMFINDYTCYHYDNKQQFMLFLKNNEKVTLFEE